MTTRPVPLAAILLAVPAEPVAVWPGRLRRSHGEHRAITRHEPGLADLERLWCLFS